MAIMCRFHGGPKDGAEELLENAPERLVFPILPEPPIGYVRLEEAEKTSPTLLPRDACYERCGHLGGTLWRITTMREWKVRQLNVPRGHIELICPDCKLRVVVHKISWLRASRYATRPCTGCFHTFWIPGRKP